jgi:hypothetical protein
MEEQGADDIVCAFFFPAANPPAADRVLSLNAEGRAPIPAQGKPQIETQTEAKA